MYSTNPVVSLACQPYFPRVSMRVWKVGRGKGKENTPFPTTLHTHMLTRGKYSWLARLPSRMFTFPSLVALVTVHLLNTSSATSGIFLTNFRRGVVMPPHAASVVLRNALSHLGLFIMASATALSRREGGREGGMIDI